MLEHPMISDGQTDLRELIGRTSNEDIIDFCQKRFQSKDAEQEYWKIVRDAILFDPKLFSEKYLPLIKLIKKITPFPQIIITTNIDNCLEHTREFNPNVYFRLHDFGAVSPHPPGTYHIHGYLERIEESLLTRSMYIPRYNDAGFQSFLRSVLRENSALFLGYQLQEQGIKDILLQAKGENPEILHFLLAPEEDGLNHAIMTLHNDIYGVRTIQYGTRDEFQNALAGWVARNFGTALKEE